MKKIIPFILIAFLFSSYNCTLPDKKPDYEKIAWSIIDKVIVLGESNYYLEGISRNDVYSKEVDGCKHIELQWQKDAKGLPPKENYLILDLSFRFCQRDSMPGFGNQELNIGKMEVQFNSSGKGHDDIDETIKKIILKEKTSFKSTK